MDAREMSVPVGFPGEHRKISFIDGSASIVFFTCITLRLTMFSPRTEIETYVIHTQAGTSLFSSSPPSAVSSRFTLMMLMWLACVHTAYMPYMGGMIDLLAS